MTINLTAHVRSLALLAATLLAGCAPAYHSYSAGCSIDCKYCVPPPLPFTDYEDRECHSDAVSRYLSLPPQPVIDQETEMNTSDQEQGGAQNH